MGTRRLTEPSPLDIQGLGKRLRAARTQRRNGTGGAGAEENYVAAMGCLYRRAGADGFLTQAQNPAAKVVKPRRQPSTRRALPDVRLAEINKVAVTTGDDPALDSLLLRLHTEPARRCAGVTWTRSSASSRCGRRGTERWQPVSPTLMRSLLAHWNERGELDPTSDASLLRYRDRRPLTYRRYDGLWQRIGEHLDWVAVQGISTHWLRHTMITWVERTFGYAVARAFAGHSQESGDAGAIVTYIKAELHEVAAAVAMLTGEPHPMAT